MMLVRAAIGSRTRAIKPFGLVRRFPFALLFALLLSPIVGHGCHGDDIDHEPVLATDRTHSEARP